MKPRDLVCAGIGALAYPLGYLIGRLIAGASPIYPTDRKEKP